MAKPTPKAEKSPNYIYMYICVYIYIHIYTHIYTYIYIFHVSFFYQSRLPGHVCSGSLQTGLKSLAMHPGSRVEISIYMVYEVLCPSEHWAAGKQGRFWCCCCREMVIAVIWVGKGAQRWGLDNICKTAAPLQGPHPYSLLCLLCWPGIRVKRTTESQAGWLTT